MDSINVLIVEDTLAESNALEEVLTKNGYHVVGVAKTHKEALALFYTTKVDVAIIDIFLDGSPDGISFAETINAIPERAKPFVFLTSSTDRNIFERAKLTHPYSYLVKPFNELEILYAIDTAVEKFYNQSDAFLNEESATVISTESLFIKKGRSLKKVLINDIIFIEVEEKYCNIITEKEKFVILISLVKILELLDKTKFYRTHRNFIVNSEKIEEIVLSDNLILLQGNHKATLSDTYKDITKKIRTLR
ncbi:MAG: response regulator transcription factor [Flavobacteriaceae bacterium]